jgi:hypothetical protein
MPLNCDPAQAKIGRLLIICPEEVRVQIGVDESDMETFSGNSFLRVFPTDYTPIWENKIEWMANSSLPKVGTSKYGFTAKIDDERVELLYAIQQVIWNSTSTVFAQGRRWQPITIVDFCNPSIPGYEAGTDEAGYRYQVRYGAVQTPSTNFAVRGFGKGGFSIEFKTYQFSMRPG